MYHLSTFLAQVPTRRRIAIACPHSPIAPAEHESAAAGTSVWLVLLVSVFDLVGTEGEPDRFPD